MNGDGYPDVVTGTEVYLNPGHGEFTNVMGMEWFTPTGRLGETTSIVGVDVDGDGDNDLVISQPNSGTAGSKADIFLLTNPGDGLAADDTGMAHNGWWTDPASVQALGLHEDGSDVPHSNAVKGLDINADNKADLVLALVGKPPAIWVNPGLATTGIHPTSVAGESHTLLTLVLALALRSLALTVT